MNAIYMFCCICMPWIQKSIPDLVVFATNQSWALSLIPPYPGLILGTLQYFSRFLFFIEQYLAFRSMKISETCTWKKLTRFLGSFPCLEQVVFELIHICDSWCCYIHSTSTTAKPKSSSSYGLALRGLLFLIISLNADQFSSPPNTLTESHPMKACSLSRPSQISSPNDVPCLLMSVCLVRAWPPHLV